MAELPADHRPAAVARLADALRDANFYVRINAIRHLGNLGAREHIPDLLPFLDSSSEDERVVAKRALKKLGHPVE